MQRRWRHQAVSQSLPAASQQPSVARVARVTGAARFYTANSYRKQSVLALPRSGTTYHGGASDRQTRLQCDNPAPVVGIWPGRNRFCSWSLSMNWNSEVRRGEGPVLTGGGSRRLCQRCLSCEGTWCPGWGGTLSRWPNPGEDERDILTNGSESWKRTALLWKDVGSSDSSAASLAPWLAAGLASVG